MNEMDELRQANADLRAECERLNKRVTDAERLSLQLRQDACDATTTLTQMRISEDAWLLERDSLHAELELQTTRVIEREERLAQMDASWKKTEARLTAAEQERDAAITEASVRSDEAIGLEQQLAAARADTERLVEFAKGYLDELVNEGINHGIQSEIREVLKSRAAIDSARAQEGKA